MSRACQRMARRAATAALRARRGPGCQDAGVNRRRLHSDQLRRLPGHRAVGARRAVGLEQASSGRRTIG
jgi:hypothetical protein